METKTLEQAGLTEKEARVYLILLEEGPVTAGPVIKRSGLHKATVYTIIQRLLERGLASYVIKGTARHYSASDPEILLDILKEKETNLQKILPQLKVKKERSEEKETASVYEGTRAVKTALKAYFGGIKPDDIQRLFVVSEKSIGPDIDPLFHYLNKLRSSHGVKAKFLWSQSARKYGEKRSKIPHTEIKFVSEPVSNPAVFSVHGDTSVIEMTEAKNPVMIKLKNRGIAESMKQYFDLLWNQNVIVYKGMEEVAGMYYEFLREMKKGEEYLVLGSTYGRDFQKYYTKFFRKYHTKRVKKGIRFKILTNPDVIGMVSKDTVGVADPELKFSQMRTLPQALEGPISVNIYKSKCAIIILRKDPMAFVIENKEITESYRRNFNHLWNQEIQVSRGYDAVWNFLQEYTKAKEVRILGANGIYFDKHPEHLPIMKKLMKKRKTPFRNLVEISAKGNPWLSTPNLETRFLPNEFKSSSIASIFDGKVVIAQWSEKEPIVMRIENKNVYESYVKQFDQLWNQRSFVYTGRDGVKIVFEEASNSDEVFWMGNVSELNIGKSVLEKYLTKLAKNKSEEWILTLEGHSITMSPVTNARYLPKEYVSPIMTAIYGNKVVTINWKPPITTTITEDKDLAEAYKKQFKLLWKTAKSK